MTYNKTNGIKIIFLS